MTWSGFTPGWYPDPAGGGWRWWDGGAWTTATLPAAGPAGPGAPTTPGWAPRPPGVVAPPGWAPLRLAGLLASEQGIARWAGPAPALYGLCQVAGLLDFWTRASAWQRWIHQLRVIFDHSGTPGYVAPTVPQPPGQGAFGLLGLVALVPLVVFLVWQYRAAAPARALRYPAARSPGWGVGAWFVPVVNLWMPYQALRDCLPPGHPRRARLWLPWVGLLVSALSTVAAEACLVEVRPLGVVLVAGVVVLDALVYATAYRLVGDISADHRRAGAQSTG